MVDDFEERFAAGLHDIADRVPTGEPPPLGDAASPVGRGPARRVAIVLAAAAALLAVAVVGLHDRGPHTTTVTNTAKTSSSSSSGGPSTTSSSFDASTGSAHADGGSATEPTNRPIDHSIHPVTSGDGWSVSRFWSDDDQSCTQFVVFGVTAVRCGGDGDSVGLPLDPDRDPLVDAGGNLVTFYRAAVFAMPLPADATDVQANGMASSDTDVHVFDDPAGSGKLAVGRTTFALPMNQPTGNLSFSYASAVPGNMNVEPPTPGQAVSSLTVDLAIPDGARYPSPDFPWGWNPLDYRSGPGGSVTFGWYARGDGVVCVAARHHADRPVFAYQHCGIDATTGLDDAAVYATGSDLNGVAVATQDVITLGCEYADGSGCGGEFRRVAGPGFNLFWSQPADFAHENGVAVDHVVFVATKRDGTQVRVDVPVSSPTG